ncbi:MAG: hypothetical protein JWP35_3233 [Caulobacter sp.]|nr:hypothetical protein [Caulobacter sp.]
MKAFKLLAKLIAYYAVLAVVVWVALKVFPAWQEYLPVGRLQSLISHAESGGVFDKSHVSQVSSQIGHVGSLGGSIVWLVCAMAGALLVSLPVSWVFMEVRAQDQFDQSLIGTIVILPVVVSGIVVLVQDSLALSFSLAGIAGVANFRNTMKSPGDLMFILLAIGIGLSSGVGAVELATVMSVMFNLCFVGLWATQYGERHYMKRYLSDFDPNDTHSQMAAAAAAGVAAGGSMVMTETSTSVKVEVEGPHAPEAPKGAPKA